MRVVNVKELKARLSQYLREVDSGEDFLVTDRSRVVAHLRPPPRSGPEAMPADTLGRLIATGVRPPLRARAEGDYRRSGPGSGLSTAAIDELLDELRADSR